MPALQDLQTNGYTLLKSAFPTDLIQACARAFEPILIAQIATHEPNRGPHRHYLPMSFDPPCFDPQFFFHSEILSLVEATLGPRFVADQWGCDIPLLGSIHQQVHADYQRPLFEESPALPLPPYMLVLSFPLVDITPAMGPIEIAPGTHLLPRAEALAAVAANKIPLIPIPMQIGDALLRHPWALHRGTPNTTPQPRPLASIRYVRRWYWDASREVSSIPRVIWHSLTESHRATLRFPIVPNAD